MKRILSDAALVCASAMLFGAVPAVPHVTPPRVNHTEAASWREDLLHHVPVKLYFFNGMLQQLGE
jgi:hypothetical protein